MLRYFENDTNISNLQVNFVWTLNKDLAARDVPADNRVMDKLVIQLAALIHVLEDVR